jgi:hypothetical protein
VRRHGRILVSGGVVVREVVGQRHLCVIVERVDLVND